jgi:hypothetical protein
VFAATEVARQQSLFAANSFATKNINYLNKITNIYYRMTDPT